MVDIDLTEYEPPVNIAEEVDLLMAECRAESPNAPLTITVDGIVQQYAFNRRAISVHREEIKALLALLDPVFQMGGGGGYSFLRMPFDAKGEQWGDHPQAEALLCLAIAAELAKFCIPQRDLWKAFPGGMPYVAFL